MDTLRLRGLLFGPLFLEEPDVVAVLEDGCLSDGGRVDLTPDLVVEFGVELWPDRHGVSSNSLRWKHYRATRPGTRLS